MKKYLFLFLLLTFPVHAATFSSSEKLIDHVWNFVFDIKTEGALVSTPFTTSRFDCKPHIMVKTGQDAFPKPESCFNTYDEALADAQKDADKFEADKNSNGESSTAIETKRQLLILKNKLTP